MSTVKDDRQPALDFDPLGAQLEDPYPFYAHARAVAPVFYAERLGGWVVTRYQDVVRVLKDPAAFSSANTITPNQPLCDAATAVMAGGFPPAPHEINTDRPAHARFRRALHGAFNPRSFAALEPVVATTAGALVDDLARSSDPDLRASVAQPLPMMMILTIFGIPVEDRAPILDWCREFGKLMTTTPDVAQQVHSAEAGVAFQHHIASLIDIRRGEPGDDLITKLIHHRYDGDEPFTMNELVSMITGLVFAGHETTSSLIATAAQILLEDPRLWQTVVDDRTLIPSAVEEVLRFDSPIQTFRRLAVADVQLAGRTIPAGATVFVLLGSANRDEARFPDADTFDPRRADNGHVSFGAGLHFCTGAPLARMEARVVLNLLADRFGPDLRLADADRRHVPSILVRSWDRVAVGW